MARTSRLTCNRHGVYTFRFIVPKHLRSLIGSNELKRSLGTKDYALAKLRSAKLNFHIEHWLHRMNKKLLSDFNFSTEDLRDLKIKFPGGLEVDFDPNKPEEQAYVDNLIQTLHPVESVGKLPLPDVRAITREVVDEIAAQSHANSEQLTAALEKWQRAIGPTLAEKSARDYTSHINHFIAYAKSMRPSITTIAAVTRPLAVKYREKMEEELKIQTADKKIQVLKQFYDFAIQRAYYQNDNPFQGLTLSKSQRQRVTEPYEPFTHDELQRIFSYQTYVTFNNKPHFYWTPLLGLFTGARIEELSQLELTDIKQSGEIFYIEIHGGKNAEGGRKSIKNSQSVRQVPLHSQLIDIGFLDYVSDIQSLGEKLLFPYLVKTVNGYSKTAGRKWGEYLDTLGISDPLKVFHSLRKTLNNELKQMDVHEAARCQITGHKYESINDSTYAQRYELSHLKRMLDRAVFPSISFSSLQYQKGSCLEQIKHLCSLKQGKSKLHNRKKLPPYKL